MKAGTACFPRQARLTEAADYQRVFKQARLRSSDRYLTLLALPTEQPGSRLGLAISRKSARRAVDRNRIKRIIRDSFRRYQHQLPAMDIVVISRAGIEKCTSTELFNALEIHWVRLNQSCKDS